MHESHFEYVYPSLLKSLTNVSKTFTIPYFPEKPEIYSEIADKMAELTQPALATTLDLLSQCSLDLQPLPSIVGKHTQDAGGNAMGLTDQDPERVILEIQCSWTGSEKDEEMQQISRDMTTWLESKLPD